MKNNQEFNVVERPSHYVKGDVECISVIKMINFGCTDGHVGYLQGNIVKYLWRWENKGGITDLKKAQRYIDMLIKYVESNT